MQDMLNHFIAEFEAGAITYIIGAFCSFSWNKSQSATAMSFSTQISTQSVQETTELDVPDQVTPLSVGTNLTQPNHLIQSGQSKTKQFKQRKLKLTEALRHEQADAIEV